MSSHAGESFPVPGEYLGIITPKGSPLYCEVSRTGKFINGNWDLDPENPPSNLKGFRIILRDMKKESYMPACALIEETAKNLPDNSWDNFPISGAEEIFLALTNDSHSVEVLKRAVNHQNNNKLTYSRFEHKVLLRAKYYFRDEVRQKLPKYDLPELAEMIHKHFTCDNSKPHITQEMQIKTVTDHLKGTTPMTSSIVIKNVTYIDGIDINELTDAQIFNRISHAEEEIKSLKQIKAKSKKLAKSITEKQQNIDDLVALVDAR